MFLPISERFFSGNLFESFSESKAKLAHLLQDLTLIPTVEHSDFFLGIGGRVHFEPIGDLDPVLVSIIKKVDDLALASMQFGSPIHMEYKSELKFLRSMFFKKQFLGSIGHTLAQAINLDYRHFIDPIISSIGADEVAIKQGLIAAISKRNYELIEKLLLLTADPASTLEDQLVQSAIDEDAVLFEYLLTKGVDPRCKGGAALKIAVTCCDHEILKGLLKFDWSSCGILDESVSIAFLNQDLQSLLMLEKAGLIKEDRKKDLIKLVTKGKNVISWLKERELGHVV